MSTPATPVALVTPMVTTAKKSWWKRVVDEVGKILGVIEKDEPKIAAIAVPALQAAFPEFAVLIGGVGAMATKVLNEIVSVQTIASTAATQPTGIQRLESVLTNSQPAIDGWIQSAFPGAATISAANKTKLVQALHDIIEEVDPAAVPTVPAPTVAAA